MDSGIIVVDVFRLTRIRQIGQWLSLIERRSKCAASSSHLVDTMRQHISGVLIVTYVQINSQFNFIFYLCSHDTFRIVFLLEN